jgi:uncharacterized protein YajQ (UPF0234 family)
MPSFDIVSEIDLHELANAVDQANREVSQRFDFKGTGAKYELADYTVTLHAQVDFQLKQMFDILALKVSKRGIDVACLDAKAPEVTLNAARQEVTLRHGIDQETGKKLQRLLKDSKLKVQAAIQGDQLRVTGKQRDDLQAAMALVRKSELGLPFQFKNMRD